MATLHGPSPRVRGKRGQERRDGSISRSIPARAGKAVSGQQSDGTGRVHPRACGESVTDRSSIAPEYGPSPRVRGKLGALVEPAERPGSIPARAGKAAVWATASRVRRVHPRACGESVQSKLKDMDDDGPSPRVRGKPAQRHRGSVVIRSIPARAGKASGRNTTTGACRVHPRACGESWRIPPVRGGHGGPSPRVRGKLSIDLEEDVHDGSIPARAGKASRMRFGVRSPTVHPRACGESLVCSRWMQIGMGPSPRVRGKLPSGRFERNRGRSIPARAGKAESSIFRWTPSQVHPRACGESGAEMSVLSACSGPSPRVRGKRDGLPVSRGRHGSIPARAGKAMPIQRLVHRFWVHPRACGESVCDLDGYICNFGPSPRVRGKHPTPGPARRPSRSIPARAGKAWVSGSPSQRATVHPRACGESGKVRWYRRMSTGPSPRVRGKLQTKSENHPPTTVRSLFRPS